MVNRRILAIVAAIGLAACNSPAGPGITGTGRRILFIGNSHTYVHDVPGILQALAASAGPEQLAVASIAHSDFALIDHAYGSAPGAIARGEWSLVVLQQGWTPAGVCRDTLLLATALLGSEAHSAGAQVGLYQVWTPTTRPNHMPGTIRSYELAADHVGGMLFPAAAAFRNALHRDPSLALYSDGIHASQDGAYLVALVMYGTLFERTPVGLPARLTTRSGMSVTIPAAIAATLQEAAADVTVRGMGRSNREDGPLIPNPGRC